MLCACVFVSVRVCMWLFLCMLGFCFLHNVLWNLKNLYQVFKMTISLSMLCFVFGLAGSFNGRLLFYCNCSNLKIAIRYLRQLNYTCRMIICLRIAFYQNSQSFTDGAAYSFQILDICVCDCMGYNFNNMDSAICITQFSRDLHIYYTPGLPLVSCSVERHQEIVGLAIEFT